MSPSRSSWTSIAVTAVLVVGLVAGAAAVGGAQGDEYAADSEITVTVTDDGEVESEHVVYELPAELYQGMLMVAGMDGHDSVADYFGSMAVETRTGIGGYENAEDTERGDSYVVELTLVDIETDDLEDVETSVAEDGTVTFEMVAAEDPVYQSEAMDEETMAATGEYSVVVEMPDEISETNALETAGSVAVWHLHQDMPDRLTVEAGHDGAADDGSTDDAADAANGSETTTEDGIPGFGAGATAIAVAVCCIALRLDRRR